jgi:serine/threonine protein kinase
LGLGVLLPLQQPVLDLLARPGPHHLHFIQFAEDVMAGVMFLHGQNVAHRDIKPENLVYTDTFRVQIIDFELAIRVQDEDDTVEDDVGTDDYRAPETYDPYGEGRPKPYSPIRADRWSCGRVVLWVLSRLDDSVLCPDLFSFAHRLQDDNPMDRPPLVEWMKDEGKDGKGMVSQ